MLLLGVADFLRKDSAQSSVPAVHGQLKVHFLDVGQADSILIQTADAAMLVDAGTNEAGA